MPANIIAPTQPNIIRRMAGAIWRGFRAMANPAKRADEDALLFRQLLPEQHRRLTADTERLIPQLIDVIDGLLRDTDDLLRTDPEAYEYIFDDDAITTALDNAFLRVAQAEVVLNDRGNGATQRLATHLQTHAIDVPGWAEMLQHLCYAEVVGISIVRKVWEIRPQPGCLSKLRDPMFVIRDAGGFVPKDKRRFRPADPDWEHMFLVDNGMYPVGTGGAYGPIGFRKPIDRRDYIIHRWRNTEDRHGWGNGRLGARLYRLSKYRRPLIHTLLQALENVGGGIRYATLDPTALAGRGTNASALMSSVKQELHNAISGDTVVFPPGVSPVLFFPPNTVGDAIQNALTNYLEKLIQKQVTGIASGEGDAEQASFAYGKEVAKAAHRRDAYRAGTVAETLDRDYLSHWLELNPWVYHTEGVPFSTPPPRIELIPPGGDDANARIQVWNQCQVPIVKSDYARANGFTLATEEQIERGDAFVPAQAAGGGAGGVAGVPGSPGSAVAGASRRAGGGFPMADLIENAHGDPLVGLQTIAAKGFALPSAGEMMQAYQAAVEIKDRLSANILRKKWWALMGELTAPDITDAEWEQIVGGGEKAAPPGAPPGAMPPPGDDPGPGQPPTDEAAPNPLDAMARSAPNWWEPILVAHATRQRNRSEFSEGDHPRDENGRFTGGGSSTADTATSEPEAETLDFTKPGELAKKPSFAKKLVGVISDPKSAAKAIGAAVTRTRENMAKPLVEAGYSDRTANAIATVAAIAASTPLSFGMIASVTIPGAQAAAAIPGAAEAAAMIGGALLLKQPKETIAKAARKVAGAPAAIKAKIAQAKQDKEAIARLKAEMAKELQPAHADRRRPQHEYADRAAQWDESKHPRAKDGKFGSGGSSSGDDASEAKTAPSNRKPKKKGASKQPADEAKTVPSNRDPKKKPTPKKDETTFEIKANASPSKPSGPPPIPVQKVKYERVESMGEDAGVNAIEKFYVDGKRAGVFKSAAGEANIGKLRKGMGETPQWVREVAASRIGALLNVGAPKAEAVDHGSGPGVAIDWVDGKPFADVPYATESSVAKIAIFDFIIGNADRHAANFMTTEGANVVPIDHGLAFNEDPPPHLRSIPYDMLRENGSKAGMDLIDFSSIDRADIEAATDGLSPKQRAGVLERFEAASKFKGSVVDFFRSQELDGAIERLVPSGEANFHFLLL